MNARTGRPPGRPRAAVKLARIVGYVRPEHLAAYEREARRRGISLASLVAEALGKHLRWKKHHGIVWREGT